MDKNIINYLNNRRETWLEDRIKKSKADDAETVSALHREAIDKYDPVSYINDMSKRAGRLSLCTHPAKFNDPATKATSILAKRPAEIDGYLRTGNVLAEYDVITNAKNLDVFKFLSLTLSTGKTILEALESGEHVEGVSEYADAFLEIKADIGASSDVVTSGLKQVYFPIGKDQYHLLSLHIASGILFEVKKRLDHRRFNDAAMKAREARKNDKPSDFIIEDYPDLTIMGFGGANPQNISQLNSRHVGKAYLLDCVPPSLTYRKANPPKDNFFWFISNKPYRNIMVAFHDLCQSNWNTAATVMVRDKMIRKSIHILIERIWKVRSVEPGWSDREHYKDLPFYQKVLLDGQYNDQEIRAQYLKEIKSAILKWYLRVYKQCLGNKAYDFGENEQAVILKAITQCEGGLL